MTELSLILREALVHELRTVTTHGTSWPDTPEGQALARARWLESVYYAIYDELKHGVSTSEERITVGQIGDALRAEPSRGRQAGRHRAASAPTRPT